MADQNVEYRIRTLEDEVHQLKGQVQQLVTVTRHLDQGLALAQRFINEWLIGAGRTPIDVGRR